MITIRSSKSASEVALIYMEAMLTTPCNVYTISSNGPMTDSGSSCGDKLFGAISWPVSRFHLADGLLLEQEMFLPHDGSTVAVSWALRGEPAVAAQLIVRPFFSGCTPRSYRDVGFHFDFEQNAARLAWLPNVRGPKVFADTNGQYHDEPIRSSDRLCNLQSPSSVEGVVTPGRFEFELSSRPAVLILSMEDPVTPRHHQHIGVFLAGLMRENTRAAAQSIVGESVKAKIQPAVIV